MMRRAIVIVTVAVLVSGALPASALTPVKVIGGPAHQYWPSSNGTYLTWSSYAHRKNAVYVKRLPSGTPRRVNPTGTYAEGGSFVGSSDVLVYAQWSPSSRGDLYFFDVPTRAWTAAPAAVNGPKTWEWAPVASDRYLLFMRDSLSRSGNLLSRSLLLYDRQTKAMTTLETGMHRYFMPSFAGTTYVAWTRAGAGGWAIRYWSEAGGEHKQPTVPKRDQYSATIDEATGQIYYVRAKPPECGRFVTIRRSELGSSASSLLASFPQDVDVGVRGVSVAVDTGTSHQDLYFERVVCGGRSDIYALREVNTVP